MAASQMDGPLFRSGNMNSLSAATFGSYVGDPNQDAGPGGVFQGEALLDVRWWFQKDQVTGYTGRVPGHLMVPYLKSANQIPAALAANNIAAGQHPTTGTALTFATRSVGVEVAIPVIPYGAGGIANGTPVNCIALDFGFAWGTVVSASTTVTVANSYDFRVGMPLVIAGVGNAGGTVPLLTNVLSITDTTHIVIANAPAASLNPAAIGTGNIWGPSPGSSQSMFVTPTAALPWVAGGPALVLDPRQAIARGGRVVGTTSGTGGTVTVNGYDIYGAPMTETITLGAGVATGYGVKAWKYIASVVPNFTDTINITVGTTDVFGFHHRASYWEDVRVSWAAALMTATQGYTAPLALITASTATTADVRGTIQTGASGGGTGIGSTASNGTVSSLAMSGNRLLMETQLGPWSDVQAYPADPRTLFGVTQA